MINNGLEPICAPKATPRPKTAGNREVQNDAYSLHSPTKSLQTASPWRVLGQPPTARETHIPIGFYRSPEFFYFEILKLTLLVSVPVGVVTTTGPVVAPEGTTAVM